MNELDSRDEHSRAILFGTRRRLRSHHGSVEIVDGGQQFLCQLHDAPLLRGRRFACGAPAVVLEVGLGSLRQLQVLVGLAGPRGELLEIMLDLRLVVGGTFTARWFFLLILR
jgi:hypothetical protein